MEMLKKNSPVLPLNSVKLTKTWHHQIDALGPLIMNVMVMNTADQDQRVIDNELESPDDAAVIELGPPKELVRAGVGTPEGAG